MTTETIALIILGIFCVLCLVIIAYAFYKKEPKRLTKQEREMEGFNALINMKKEEIAILDNLGYFENVKEFLKDKEENPNKYKTLEQLEEEYKIF